MDIDILIFYLCIYLLPLQDPFAYKKTLAYVQIMTSKSKKCAELYISFCIKTPHISNFSF